MCSSSSMACSSYAWVSQVIRSVPFEITDPLISSDLHFGGVCVVFVGLFFGGSTAEAKERY
jgi:hypothetical protein